MDIAVLYNTDKQGIEVKFNEKPRKEVLEQLKVNGFRWSKKQELWYAKDTEERKRFIERLIDMVIQDKKGECIEYPFIDIEDIENYTVSEELSRRENQGHWIFRTEEKDHQKELQAYLRECNQIVLDALKWGDNVEVEYKTKKWLQSYKKRYYAWYMKNLTLKANDPSWAVTGRAGRNQRRDEKNRARMDALMREYILIQDEFKSKVRAIDGQLKRAQRSS